MNNMQLGKGSLRLHVVIDRESFREDLIPVHGLSLLLEIECQGALLKVLFGLGPSYSALTNNLTNLGYSLSDVDVVVLPMNSKALIGSLKEAVKDLLNIMIIASPNVAIPSSLLDNTVRVASSVPLTSCSLVLPPLGSRGELILAINTKQGLVLIVPCSHVGLSSIIRHVVNRLKVRSIYGIIGGLHLSVYDVLTFKELETLIDTFNIKIIIPLYCTGIKARDKVLKLLEESYIYSPELGCGLEYRL